MQKLSSRFRYECHENRHQTIKILNFCIYNIDIINRNPFTDPLHISALILARGGSKGIPLKNIAKFGNSSLISNALHHIKEVRNFNSIWVSTDNNLIASEVNKRKFI